MSRTTETVFRDHLARANRHDIEGDIATNFAPGCVLLTSYGRFEGHDGVRQAADLLARQIPNAQYSYTQQTVHGEIAFLEWTADGDSSCVRDGADTFLIQDGRIRTMTIHYTVQAYTSQ